MKKKEIAFQLEFLFSHRSGGGKNSFRFTFMAAFLHLALIFITIYQLLCEYLSFNIILSLIPSIREYRVSLLRSLFRLDFVGRSMISILNRFCFSFSHLSRTIQFWNLFSKRSAAAYEGRTIFKSIVYLHNYLNWFRLFQHYHYLNC